MRSRGLLELFSGLSSLKALEVTEMKSLKILLCIVFTLVLGTCSSTISIGESQDFSGKPAEVAVTSDDAMLLNPEYTYDSKMLIPGNTQIDPKMLAPMIQDESDQDK